MEHLFVVNADHAEPIEATTLPRCSLEERAHLQEWVIDHPEILGEEVLVITSEYDEWEADIDGSPESDRLDILGLDNTGQLVVVELKRESAKRNVHLQAITYAALVSTFDLETLAKAYSKFWTKRGKSIAEDAAQEEILRHAGGALSAAVLRRPRIVLVAQRFAKQVTHSTVWLSELELDIRLIQMSVWRLADGKVFAGFTKIYPTPQVEEFTLGPARREAKVAAEGIQETKRSTRAVNRIVRAEVLPQGTELKIKPSGPSAPVRTRIEQWLSEDKARAVAVWQNEKSRSIKWSLDGSRYTPSGLAQHIYKLVEGAEPKGLQGPKWYVFEPDESLGDVPESVKPFVGLSLVEIATSLPEESIPDGDQD